MTIEEAAEIAEAVGILEEAYPNTRLINCADDTGIIHSFYMNGTCMFRKQLGDKKAAVIKLKKSNPDDVDIARRFIWFCNAVANRPHDIAALFKE